MVQWWKTKSAIRAKLVVGKDGSYEMHMEGEKYPQPNYPRGYVLFGELSKLKHEIKNQIFNDSWYLLEDGVPNEQMVARLKESVLPQIFELAGKSRYSMLPEWKLSRPVRELWRALGEVEKTLTPERAKRCKALKEILCFILQEDDAYRFRFQWLCGFMHWWQLIFTNDPARVFVKVLPLLEHGEIIGDMKERQRLLGRILKAVLEDADTRDTFNKMVRELNWKKLKLSKQDKYFFRGKYFKVDYPYFEY